MGGRRGDSVIARFLQEDDWGQSVLTEREFQVKHGTQRLVKVFIDIVLLSLERLSTLQDVDAQEHPTKPGCV